MATVRTQSLVRVLVTCCIVGNSDAFTPTSSSALDAAATVAYQNSADPAFPWRFEGRAMLRPALVRVDDVECDYTPLSLFGWTIGGCVALEYDTSPAAGMPYREFVVLRSLAWLGGLAVGQVGKALYVNETKAVTMCEDIWDLPANRAKRLDFTSGDRALEISVDIDEERFEVKGWSALQSDKSERNVQLPLLWTPAITGIWTDAMLLWLRPKGTTLDLRKLQVGGSASLRPSGKTNTSPSIRMIPLGVDIILRNATIEISPPLLI